MSAHSCLVTFYYLAQKEICTPGVEILFGKIVARLKLQRFDGASQCLAEAHSAELKPQRLKGALEACLGL